MSLIATKTERKMSARGTKEARYKYVNAPAEVALYYGFSLFHHPNISRDDFKKARAITDPDLRDKAGAAQCLCLEEKVALLRFWTEQKLENANAPAFLYFDSSILPENHNGKSGKEKAVALEILGASGSIAEALLIKTTLEILKEAGESNLSVHLNSVGDRDTMGRFSRELSAFYRKNIEELSPHCRGLLKKDPFAVFYCRDEKCRNGKNNAPKTLNFLSESARHHFKGVLEYLEFLEIPYEIDHGLLGSRGFSSQTVFEIHNMETAPKGEPLATGSRYAGIAKKLGMRHDVPGIGVTIRLPKNSPRRIKFFKPKIYFVQLGFEAKLKSLKLIELLRKEKIPLYQALSRDRLGAQLSVAETAHLPYTIIMGQKEAIEDTVIVRDMATRSQETVKISDLPKYLKKL